MYRYMYICMYVYLYIHRGLRVNPGQLVTLQVVICDQLPDDDDMVERAHGEGVGVVGVAELMEEEEELQEEVFIKIHSN